MELTINSEDHVANMIHHFDPQFPSSMHNTKLKTKVLQLAILGSFIAILMPIAVNATHPEIDPANLFSSTYNISGMATRVICWEDSCNEDLKRNVDYPQPSNHHMTICPIVPSNHSSAECPDHNSFPAPPFYACSGFVNGTEWRQNTTMKTFEDPIPSGNFPFQVNITFVGVFNCDDTSEEIHFRAFFNTMYLIHGTFPANPLGGCSCNIPCMMNYTVTAAMGGHSLIYEYGGYASVCVVLTVVPRINMFRLELEGDNGICLSKVILEFLYAPMPLAILTSIDPPSGSQDGGTDVLITGEGFMNTTLWKVNLYCNFGEAIAPATVIDAHSIRCTTPSSPRADTVNVTLTHESILYCQNYLHFEYQANNEGFKLMDTILKYWYAAALLVGALIGIPIIVISVRRCRRKRNDYQLLLRPTSRSILASEVKEDIPFSEIQLAEKIGRGNFGEVYKAYWRGTVIAVKKTKLPAVTGEEEEQEFYESFEKEAKIIRSLRHPNIVQFLGIARVGENEICIITEYMPKGNLNALLHSKSINFDWALKFRIAMDVSRGMNYLHKCNPVIIHRDLKSHNLLVDDNFKVKVSDFGLAKLVTQQVSEMTSCGTPAWTAPEVLRNEKYTEKADVYSFGIVFWELVTREEPHHGKAPHHIIFAVGNQGLRPIIPTYCPKEVTQLIQDCWTENPNDRPPFDVIMSTLEDLSLTVTL